MIKLRGHIEVNNGVRIVTNWDLCRYYQWHINKHFYNTIKTQLPRYGSHITIVHPYIHKITNYDKVKYLHGKSVDFYLFPEKLYQSKINFWIPVKCDEIEKLIKDTLGLKDDSNYWGLHATVANRKGL